MGALDRDTVSSDDKLAVARAGELVFAYFDVNDHHELAGSGTDRDRSWQGQNLGFQAHA